MGQEFFRVPGRIDWAALRRQKQWLVGQAATSPEADGLLHLLDAIQDAAVDRAGLAAATVFGPDEDAGGQ